MKDPSRLNFRLLQTLIFIIRGNLPFPCYRFEERFVFCRFKFAENFLILSQLLIASIDKNMRMSRCIYRPPKEFIFLYLQFRVRSSCSPSASFLILQQQTQQQLHDNDDPLVIPAAHDAEQQRWHVVARNNNIGFCCPIAVIASSDLNNILSYIVFDGVLSR